MQPAAAEEDFAGHVIGERGAEEEDGVGGFLGREAKDASLGGRIGRLAGAAVDARDGGDVYHFAHHAPALGGFALGRAAEPRGGRPQYAERRHQVNETWGSVIC